jgi:hypothetical protein
MNFIEPNYDQILPPFDVTAGYYAVQSSDRNLETRVVKYIGQHRGAQLGLHRELAELLSILRPRSGSAALPRMVPQRRRSMPQLVITTGIDLGIELSLLRKGIPFTRITQFRDASRLVINEYKGIILADNQIHFPGVGDISIDRHDLDALEMQISTYGQRIVGDQPNEIHALSLHGLTAPLLYKFHGSQDIEGSCILSTEQALEFARRHHKQGGVPAQIAAVISNTPLLLLGCGTLDPDFRLTYYTLLREQIESNPSERRYAAGERPDLQCGDRYRHLEAQIWEQLKADAASRYRITVLEERGDTFLGKLCQRVQGLN